MKPIVKYIGWLDWFRYKDYFISGITLFPFIFIHKNFENTVDGLIKENHEKIHFQQMLETYVLGFYIIYIWEFLVNLIKYRLGFYISYNIIRFEREAFNNEFDLKYLDTRNKLAWKEIK